MIEDEKPDDYCPISDDHKHVPDWNSLSLDNDGGEIYVDIHCSLCGKSGCLGSMEKLKENISW